MQTCLGTSLPVENAVALEPFAHILTHRHLRFAPFLLNVESLPRLRLDGYSLQRWIDPTQPQALGLAAWVTALLGRLPELSSHPDA